MDTGEDMYKLLNLFSNPDTFYTKLYSEKQLKDIQIQSHLLHPIQ